eukprot:TRINITY_DN14872_c0_g1_i1.p1 TRINITY_DN14872_c0_g1~~TRINITY_DN14872_c0_g1_i1.p1  ORF type:complete len:550 (-),score=136.59 TRINITY_DN14872_c0_g1_i1:447-2096(-)
MAMRDTLYIEVGEDADTGAEETLLESNADRKSWRTLALLAAAACFVGAGVAIGFRPMAGLKQLDDRDLADFIPTTTIDQCPDAGTDPSVINVVSYNLFWWCVSDQYRNCQFNADGSGFNRLYERIKLNHPFDLIGLQECNNVTKIVHNTGYADCLDYYAPPVKEGNDVAQAWNKNKYTKISEGTEVVAKDRYGKRRMNWVRLAVKTGGTIFFANTHGPLEQCGGDLGRKIGDAYVEVINKRKQKDDIVVFTGDFNCGQNTDTMDQLAGKLSQAAVGNSFDGADHIYTNGLAVISKASVEGKPSDHQLLKASFRMPAAPAPTTEIPSKTVAVPPAAEVTDAVPVVWNVAPSQTLMPVSTTAAPAVLATSLDVASGIKLVVVAVVVLLAVALAAMWYYNKSISSTAGDLNRGLRVARRSNPLSPDTGSVRDVGSPLRTGGSVETGFSMENDSMQTPRFTWNFGEAPPMATPERPAPVVDKSRQLKEACVEGAELEVYSRTTQRWLMGKIVQVNGNWITAEYTGGDGNIRRNNVDLSSDDVHERLRVSLAAV